MNLYLISDKNYDWCCYAFAKTRNRAKMLVAKHFFMDYIDMRASILKHGVLNVPTELIVDCPEDDGYDIVQKCGYSYQNEE